MQTLTFPAYFEPDLDLPLDDEPRRAPRYAEIGQSAVDADRSVVKIRRGHHFTRIQTGVELVPMGLHFADEVIDPRSEIEVDDLIAQRQDPEPPAVDHCLDNDQARDRITLLEQHVTWDMPLSLVLEAADALHVGRTSDPETMPAFDLSVWLTMRRIARGDETEYPFEYPFSLAA